MLDNDLGSLDGTLEEVNLRLVNPQYRIGLNRHSTYELPSSISQLWSLQTLIIKGIQTIVAPSEIWKMSQLRHVEIWSICLPSPPPSGEHVDDIFVLQNLQTLREVKNLILIEEVCKRIPNIKELHLHYDFAKQDEASSCYHLHNVACLSKLESLRYSCWGWKYAGDSLQNLKLPSSLKELTLSGCHLVWDDMAMVGLLPHLEILELLDDAVVGPKWDSVEEQFLCLRHLQIDDCGLIYWSAESSDFPVLETLSLRSLSKLDEIPSAIGEIPTLEEMLMLNCSESATISAVEIVEEQESLGNHVLQLQLKFWEKTEAEIWREKLQELGFTCQNLLIYGIQR